MGKSETSGTMLMIQLIYRGSSREDLKFVIEIDLKGIFDRFSHKQSTINYEKHLLFYSQVTYKNKWPVFKQITIKSDGYKYWVRNQIRLSSTMDTPLIRPSENIKVFTLYMKIYKNYARFRTS